MEPKEYGATLVDTAEYLLSRVVGLDVNDPQEHDTPRRYVEALRELTSPRHFAFTMFETNLSDMVIEKGIPFATLCRHHLLPFTGVCHIAYVPNGKMAGLSKLPRLVQFCAARLSTQESLTAMIADSMATHLNPQGVGVIMQAQHTCMAIRGARAIGVVTQTAAMRGVFADHDRTAKMEFLEAIR